MDHGQHQPQIAGDQLLPRLPVPGLGPAEECLGLLIFQHLQLGGVDTAELHFVLHPSKTSCPGDAVLPVSPGREVSYCSGRRIFFCIRPVSMDFLWRAVDYPRATSKIIIIRKPAMTPKVPPWVSWLCRRLASGMSSSTTT